MNAYESLTMILLLGEQEKFASALQIGSWETVLKEYGRSEVDEDY